MRVQLNAVTATSACGLYTYLQPMTAAANLTSGMPPAALHSHNQCQKPLLTELMRLQLTQCLAIVQHSAAVPTDAKSHGTC